MNHHLFGEQGEAFGNGANQTPKIWRNGKYTALNDESMTSKPADVTITNVIDVASNGLVLVQVAENGVKKTGILPPVEVQKRDDALGKWVTAKDLKVAKWESAFDQTGFKNQHPEGLVGGTFSDVDRFRVRVNTQHLQEEYRKIYIATTGSADGEYNDDATEVLLELDVNPYGRSDGFLSKPIILVADTVDNTFKNDNAQNDQSHIAALGSKVEFRIKQANGDLVGRLPVHKKKTIHVEVKLLWQGSDAPTQQSLDNIAADTKIAKEIYAQVGIDVTFTISGSRVTLEGVNLLDGLNLDNRGELLPEGEAVLDNFATPNQADVIGLYIEGGIVSNAGAGVSNGIAIWDNQEVLPHALLPNLYWHDTVSAKYKGTFLVNAARSSRATFSHELGHVLGLFHLDQEKNHRDTSAASTRNIMYGGGTTYFDLYESDKKRFRAFQQLRMHDSQFAKPIPD